jgi:hypothetical protein
MEAVTPESAAAAFAECYAGAIAGAPCDPPERGWHPYPLWSSDVVGGRTFKTTAERFPWSRPGPRLILGPDGVSWLNAQGQTLTVRYEQLVGVAHEPGCRTLVGADGFRVRVQASEWRDGASAIAEIDRVVPPGLVIAELPGG